MLLVASTCHEEFKTMYNFCSATSINPLAAIDAKTRHLHPPQVQALSRAH